MRPVNSLEAMRYERITAEKRCNQSATRKLNSSRGHVGQIRGVDLPSPRKLGSSYGPTEVRKYKRSSSIIKECLDAARLYAHTDRAYTEVAFAWSWVMVLRASRVI